jgi:nucleoside-diphosphate-sugar epimerase
MRHDLMVNDFAYKAIVDRSLILFAGDTKRTFIHINDAIRAYIFALYNSDTMKGGVYNVGSNNMNLSKKDIATNIAQYVKFELIESNLPDYDKRDFEISFDKINKIGFTTKYTLDEGIRELIKVYSYHIQYIPYKII